MKIMLEACIGSFDTEKTFSFRGAQEFIFLTNRKEMNRIEKI